MTEERLFVRMPTHSAGHPSFGSVSLYDKLERIILPLFHRERDSFIHVMRHCISLNGSFFNTQRMVLQYVVKAYLE
jgi:starch phosphorylase